MPVKELHDSEESHRALRTDETLSELIDRHGYLRIEPAEDSFQRLVLSIIRQQVSMASAAAMRERLFSQYELSPSAMIEASQSELQSVGLSEAKAAYIDAIANAFEEKGWSREFFATKDDQAVVDELTEIYGIGPWTAKMYLQFGLAREDVFPVEDLGIRKAMKSLYDTRTRDEMKAKAEEWAPYRSIASLYLWRFTEE